MNATTVLVVPRPEPADATLVAELLERYLLSSAPAAWPGTDGLTVAEAIGERYRAEARAGRVPDFAELVRGHPELADALTAFFDAAGPDDRQR